MKDRGSLVLSSTHVILSQTDIKFDPLEDGNIVVHVVPRYCKFQKLERIATERQSSCDRGCSQLHCMREMRINIDNILTDLEDTHALSRWYVL